MSEKTARSSVGMARVERAEVERHEQPLVRIHHDRVRLLDAVHGPTPLGQNADRAAVRGVDVEPRVVLAHTGDLGEPGRRSPSTSSRPSRPPPSAGSPHRTSASIAARSAATSSLNTASLGMRTTFVSPRPSTIIAFSSELCAWSDAYTRSTGTSVRPAMPRARIIGAQRSRAAASACSTATDAVSYTTPVNARADPTIPRIHPSTTRLELRRGGRRLPRHRAHVERGGDDLAEQRGSVARAAEVAEERRMAPVHDSRHHDRHRGRRGSRRETRARLAHRQGSARRSRPGAPSGPIAATLDGLAIVGNPVGHAVERSRAVSRGGRSPSDPEAEETLSSMARLTLHPADQSMASRRRRASSRPTCAGSPRAPRRSSWTGRRRRSSRRMRPRGADIDVDLRHVPPDADLATPMGKVGGVLTGVRLASHERVDHRRRRRALRRRDRWRASSRALETADVVRPQNYFEPLPWHARWDTGRMLLNRVTGGDWPGTLGVRRSMSARHRRLRRPRDVREPRARAHRGRRRRPRGGAPRRVRARDVRRRRATSGRSACGRPTTSSRARRAWQRSSRLLPGRRWRSAPTGVGPRSPSPRRSSVLCRRGGPAARRRRTRLSGERLAVRAGLGRRARGLQLARARRRASSSAACRIAAPCCVMPLRRCGCCGASASSRARLASDRSVDVDRLEAAVVRELGAEHAVTPTIRSISARSSKWSPGARSRRQDPQLAGRQHVHVHEDVERRRDRVGRDAERRESADEILEAARVVPGRLVDDRERLRAARREQEVVSATVSSTIVHIGRLRLE